MRAEEIIQWMNNPDLLELDSLQQLKRVVKEFPYFQTATILHLINLKKVQDSDFQQELRKTTLYAGDRRKLFLFIELERFASFNTHLKQQVEQHAENSSFALIDVFLSDHEGGFEQPLDLYPIMTIGNTDYLSTLKSEGISDFEENNKLIPLQHHDIIDSFLEKDKEAPIRIELHGTDEEYLPEEDDSSAFFSETLAKIYLKQKKYDKALEIIQKLNLLYPEKNIYFADQIRFLEKLITNIKKTE